MDDEAKRSQVIRQLQAVAHFATVLAGVSADYVTIFQTGKSDRLIDQVGLRTASQMEILGDMLNGMDACDEEDAEFDPVFEAAHRIWPDAVRKMGWFGPAQTAPAKTNRQGS